MKKQGTALIMALTVMVVVSIGIAAVLQTMISYANMKQTSLNRVIAQYLAEGDMVYGLWQCQNKNWTNWSVNTTIQGQQWTIDVKKAQQADLTYAVWADVQYK